MAYSHQRGHQDCSEAESSTSYVVFQVLSSYLPRRLFFLENAATCRQLFDPLMIVSLVYVSSAQCGSLISESISIIGEDKDCGLGN